MRRERVRGRAALVVEFQPKRGGVAPSGDLERQASTMAGALWIDDVSQQVIRVESYFREEFDRIVPGSSIRVEQMLVNDEVWLPSRIDTNFRLSLAFGHSTQTLSTMRYTDHKKFSVETESTVTLPDPGR